LLGQRAEVFRGMEAPGGIFLYHAPAGANKRLH